MLAGGGGSSLTSRDTILCHCEGAKRLSQSHYRYVKKAAFTLAEVLITLAIIGVVAALTIPTLVQNYQRKSWDTASQVFERKLGEALKVMNSQQTLAGYRDTESFVNELSKHLKITKICKNDDLTSCFEDKVYWGTDNEEIDVNVLKTAKNFGVNNWNDNTNIIGVQFGNGTTGLIAYNTACTQDPFSNDKITFADNKLGTDCLAILYDTSGHKNPNKSGDDLQSINVAKLGKGCYAEVNGLCFASAPFKPTALTYAECEAIKGDLGLQYCSNGNDYFAGAVRKCKDEGGRLSTKAEVAKIAEYVYNTSGIGTDQDVLSLTLDYDKVAEIGFSTSSGSSFSVWTGEETNQDRLDTRYFNSTYTSMRIRFRGYNNGQAVCIAD